MADETIPAALGDPEVLEALIEAFLHGIDIGVAIADVESGVVLGANDALCSLLGRDVDDVVGSTGVELGVFPESDLAPFLLNEGVVRGELKIRRDDGSVITVEVTSQRFGPDGSLILGLVQDRTEQDRVKAALLESEAAFRTLFRQSPIPMWVWDPDDFRFLDVNEAVEQQYGYTREELLSMTTLDIRPEAERERLRAIIDMPHELRHYGTWRHKRRNGSEFDVDIWSTLVSWRGARARITLAIDISERVRAEKALEEATRRYRSLVESIPAVVFLDRIDEHYTNVYTSPQVEGLLGYTSEEWEQNPRLLDDILHPDDREWVLAEAAGQAAGPRPAYPKPYMIEYRLIAKDGRTVWVRDQAVPLRDAAGVARYWQGFWLDVTEQKEAEFALREAEGLYRMVVDNISDLVALVAPDGTVLYASPSHEAVLGYTPEEMVGRHASEGTTQEFRAESLRSLAEAAAGHRTSAVRFQMVHKDGHQVELEGVGWQPILDESGEVAAILAVSRDMTERVQAEEERARFVSRLVAATEEERRRVSDDIHDAPIQALTALLLRLEGLETHVDEAGRTTLDRSIGSVREVIRSLRGLMFELRPRSLDREGLVIALQDHLRSFSEDTEIDVRLHVDALEREPDAETAVVLYRIAQEALTNVRKHAKAAHVMVTLETADGGARLVVQDDGIGVPAEPIEAFAHVGIDAMRDRAELVGGSLRIAPAPEGGTLVEVWVPGTGD